MLTLDQHMQVYRVLDAEACKAAKAAAKAKSVFDSAPSVFGGSLERETAAVLLSLRNAQSKAAHDEAAAYFDNYIKNAA